MSDIENAIEELVDSRIESWWEGINLSDHIDIPDPEDIASNVIDGLDYDDIAKRVDIEGVRDDVLEAISDNLPGKLIATIKEIIQQELKEFFQQLTKQTGG